MLISMPAGVCGSRWSAVRFACHDVRGCASSNTQSQTGASGIDLTTESDEPEARKETRIRTELAAGYFEQGQTSVALDEIKQALLSDPNYAPALSLRGLAYMRISEPKLAEESFRRALQTSPRDADVAHNFGWMLCQQGRNSGSNRAVCAGAFQPFIRRAIQNAVGSGRVPRQGRRSIARG